jgi:hypothetical protein
MQFNITGRQSPSAHSHSPSSSARFSISQTPLRRTSSAALPSFPPVSQKYGYF